MRSIWRLLGWFVIVEVLTAAFGVTTAPLLLAFVADTAVALLLVRSCMEMRAALPASMPIAQSPGFDSGGR